MEAKEGEGGHVTTSSSPAAFVEGGIQDLCDDACSICLEDFSELDPSTATNCRHEFHLHCILEWCQRSSQCPMCWQAVGLKDPLSQELFEGVERERNIRAVSASRASISQYTIPRDLDFGLLGMDINEPQLQQHILLHLANVVRTRSVDRGSMREGLGVAGPRESSRSQLSAQGSSHFSVFPSHPDATQSCPVSSLTNPVDGETEMRTSTARDVRVSPNEMSALPSVSAAPTARRGFSFTHRHPSSSSYQDRGGSSELQPFSGSFKARFSEVSMRYKETLTRTTRDLKERLFSRSSSMSGIGSGVMGELTAGIAAVSRIVDRLESKNGRVNQALTSSQSGEHTESEANKRQSEDTHEGNSRNDLNGATSSSA